MTDSVLNAKRILEKTEREVNQLQSDIEVKESHRKKLRSMIESSAGLRGQVEVLQATSSQLVMEDFYRRERKFAEQYRDLIDETIEALTAPEPSEASDE